MSNFSLQTFFKSHNAKTKLCGIVNVTPDSFSDGGKYNTTEAALSHAEELLASGADMLDIGGESTRPGSHFVEIADECVRVVPVISALKKEFPSVPLSIDTWKSEVARASIDAGADIVNDITGFAGDVNMARVVAEKKAACILMFNPVVFRKEHPSCAIFPTFNLNESNEAFLQESEMQSMRAMQIVDAMKFYLTRSALCADDAGIPRKNIMLDPGIGFGLTAKENLLLLKNIDGLHEMGFAIFLGVSRKRFLQNILERANISHAPETADGFQNRDIASSILTAIAVQKKVEVVRVHSIVEHNIAREVSFAVQNAEIARDTNFAAYKNN